MVYHDRNHGRCRISQSTTEIGSILREKSQWLETKVPTGKGARQTLEEWDGSFEEESCALEGGCQATTRRVAAIATQARSEKKPAGISQPALSVAVKPAPLVPGLADRLPRHHYSAGIVRLFLRGILVAAVSQRGVAAFLSLMAPCLPAPVANTGRLWLLRLGLYELTRPKQRAGDWVWIMDHTIQLGPWKCLIIVGVRLSEWQPDRGPLEHADLALLNLTPMEHSSGEEVEKQMRAALQQTGRPREVLTDGGADLKRGIELFCKDQPGVAHVRDIKHKGATLLKRHLEADRRWKRFGTRAQQTKREVTQTALAFLNPPALKNKARYMNLDSLVSWGRQVLTFLDNPKPVTTEPVDRETLTTKLSWMRKYREALEEWSELLALVQKTGEYIRQHGFHARAVAELRRQLTPLATRRTPHKMREELLEFVGEQSAQARSKERLIGASEVIESVIGKYKRMQSTHSQGGMTAMVLSVGAIVAKKTIRTIRSALTRITTQNVTSWCREHLGVTLQAQRCLAFNGNKNGIQNDHNQT
jgi:hypothetical protein